MKKIKVTRVSLTESLGTRSSAPPRSLLERQVSDLFGIRISGDSVWMMSQGFLRLPSVLRVALLIKPERSPWGFPQCLWDAPFEAVQSIQQESWMSEQRGPASPPTSLWLLGTPWTYAPLSSPSHTSMPPAGLPPEMGSWFESDFCHAFTSSQLPDIPHCL